MLVLRALKNCTFYDVLGDGTASQVPVLNSAEIFGSQIGTTSLPISTAASLLNVQQSSSARTSTSLLVPTTTSSTVHPSIGGSFFAQPVVATSLKSVHVERGAGDNVTTTSGASQVMSVKPPPGSTGDTDKPVGVAAVSCSSVSSHTISSSVLQSQAVVTCSSVCIGSSVSVAQPLAMSSISLPTVQEPYARQTVVENIVPLSVSLAAPSAISSVSNLNVPSCGTFVSSTTLAPKGGFTFTPVFGNLSQTTTSNSSKLSPVQNQPSLQTASTASTAFQPAVSVPSNSVSFGGFGNQPSFSFTASTSNQSAMPAPAVVPLASATGPLVTPPSSTQSASSAFSLSFQASSTTTSSSSNNQNTNKDQNIPLQFRGFPGQASVTSSASSTSSSAAGFAPSVVPFGNSQQPSFRPVFGNSDSQQATSGFSSFNNNADTPSFVSQPATTTQASSSNIFQTSGNQQTSSSVGGFPGISSSATPFGSSGFQSGSSTFGSSFSNSNSQPTSSSFGSFTAVSAASPFGSSTVPPGSSVFGSSVPKSDSQSSTSFGAFSGMSAGVSAFGSSSLQTGSGTFGNSSVPKNDGQPNTNSFSSFAGTAPPAFGNSSMQQGSTVFGGISGQVFNGPQSTTSAAQQLVPNGVHKPPANASGPFTFSGKSDQPPSAAASSFTFGQSTNAVNGFPMPTSVPNFGSSTPASSFTFGKPAVYHSYVARLVLRLGRIFIMLKMTIFSYDSMQRTVLSHNNN